MATELVRFQINELVYAANSHPRFQAFKMATNSFTAIRPCKSNEYKNFIKQNFTDVKPVEGNKFSQSWSYRGSLKNGLTSELSLSNIFSSPNPEIELTKLYINQAPQFINKIYNIPIGSLFYSVHKNHLWLCKRVGEYKYDPSIEYSHSFEAEIIKILNNENVEYKLTNTRPTITTIKIL